MRARVLACLPAPLYMALIWYMSSAPAPVSVESLPFQDKGAHFLGYALLSLLLGHALRAGIRVRSRLAAMFFAAGLSCLWGLLDEIHQAYVPGRSSDPYDALADAIGSMLGALLYVLLEWLWLRRRSASPG